MRLDGFKTKAEAIAYIKKTKGARTSAEAEKYLRTHLPKESVYQANIIKRIKERFNAIFVWKEAAGPYSKQGIPDISVVYKGRYYGFEVKRPYIGKLSTMQEQTIKKIRAAGGIAEVVSFPKEVEVILNGKAKTKKGS